VKQPLPTYLSTACYLGTHGQCRHGETKTPPRGVPVRFDVCACSCHRPASAGAETSEEAEHAAH
jgi:hypothetical protein